MTQERQSGIIVPVPDLNTPVITEDADRRLGRIIVRHGLLTFGLLVVATVGMAFVNIPGTRLFPARRFLDTLSILIVLIPFFVGMNRLFAARLSLGRDFVARRQWREAVAALDPFAGRGQRFLDTTGEAHYLLAQAYLGSGEPAKAEAARAFVQRYRRGPWAEKAAARPAPAPRQEKRPPPSNPRLQKRRRRF